MPPPPEERPGRKRFWFISCLLFVALLTGGTFLVLYITQPASEIPFWFPIAGIVLVATPWLFWITTCVYRSITVRKDDVERPPIRIAAVAPAAGGATVSNVAASSPATESPVDSPGGTRRVRFGNATVMGSGAAGGTSEAPQGDEVDGDHARDGTGSTTSRDEGSSQRLHESEVKQSLYDFSHINGLNLYGWISILSLLYLFLVALFVEGSQWVGGFHWALAAISSPRTFYWWLLLSGIFYHLYNQSSYQALDNISPLTFSVGNTMKRVVVIVASVLVLRNPIRPLNALGTAIAILGTFLYSQATAMGKKDSKAIAEKKTS